MAVFYAILRNTLHVKDAGSLAQFYVDKMGMKRLHFELKNGRQVELLGYNDEQVNQQQSVSLELVTVATGAAPTSPTNDPEGYWKIGIALPDVKAAVSMLRNNGVQVSQPAQFRDIGYLCHLQDPEGFTIELLQHTFEKNFTPLPVMNTSPLACDRPVIGQVTLRIADPERSLHFYRDVLGMKLLSRQKVDPYGFALYFLAFTTDVIAEDKIDDVEIREWLWQRPYTTLELQHNYKTPKDQKYKTAKDDEVGWQGLTITCNDRAEAVQYLNAKGVPLTRNPNPESPDELADIIALDPDGYRIDIVQA